MGLMKSMTHFMKGSAGSIVINLIILVWTTLLVGWQLSQDLQWSIILVKCRPPIFNSQKFWIAMSIEK
jgi:hypothetical protein